LSRITSWILETETRKVIFRRSNVNFGRERETFNYNKKAARCHNGIKRIQLVTFTPIKYRLQENQEKPRNAKESGYAYK